MCKKLINCCDKKNCCNKDILTFTVLSLSLLAYFFSFGCFSIEACKSLSGFSAFEYMFDRYQTLIVGITALATGCFAIKAVYDQIKSETKARKDIEKNAMNGKSLTYECAISAYLERIDSFIRVVNFSNRHRQNQSAALTSTLIKPAEWDFLPKGIPDILTNWHYLSDIGKENISTIVRIRHSLETINKYIETLIKRKLSGGASVSTTKYNDFDRLVKEEKSKIKKLLMHLSHNTSDL